MGERSAISWTDASWNPVTGCSHVSEGCRNCYAEALSLRRDWSAKPWTAPNAAENVVLHPDRLDQPLRWKRPRRVFVNSMSDLFHELVPFEYVDQVWDVMMQAGRHTFQVLTKRPARMLKYFTGRMAGCDVLPNLWLGTSVEDQRAADERIPLLLLTPAAVRFLSVEPLLERVSLARYLPRLHEGTSHGISYTERITSPGIDWVICGGESGPAYRPMDLDWVRDIRAECSQYGVPYFFKQRAGPRPGLTNGVPPELAVQEWPA